MPMTPPDGKLLYSDPYIGGNVNIDEHGNVQITHGYLRADWGSSYSKTSKVSDVLTDCITNPKDTYKAIPGWDGVHDSLQTYPGLVYDGSYPPTYNISGGILYVKQEPVDVQTIDIENSTDTSTEPSDLKNTKSNIRKIKPDINSDLKRV